MLVESYTLEYSWTWFCKVSGSFFRELACLGLYVDHIGRGSDGYPTFLRGVRYSSFALLAANSLSCNISDESDMLMSNHDWERKA